ncbi:hypothetical protein SOCE26_046060 [Sorangium cellulosum]|uniref:Glycosyltransferase RgtA/B/C/D-like domain-containing protein n=1 Tax=Sorangium cellulosum TaxID=56 RepID=A0A2L0EV44_SORCE|nr:hypothetical protein [Sorangium cellulosum]AUX43163.1 hypothetical protein SOCE26_046060 [Sorangium cellulosum]
MDRSATPEAPAEGAADRRPGSAGEARRASRRAGLAIALYALVTLVYAVTSSREIFATHTPFNHYALLAEAWLEGRLDLGGPPPAYTGGNDFAVAQGRTYVSFPPFPAVLIAPVVQLAGSAERVRDGQFFLGFAGLGPAVLFLALEKLSASRRSRRTQNENAALALLFALGSVYWFSAVQGTVWFAAHVVGVALACVYLYCALDAVHPLAAGLALGLGFATRTPLGFAAPLFLHEALRASRSDPRALARRLLLFAAPAALVLLALLWHNHARFGDAVEFGHRHLHIAWRPRIEKWGLFSYHYLPRNLAVVLTGLPFTGVQGAPFQINAHGLALWVTTPIYAWALWPRRTPPVFWALAATASAVAMPSLLYQNTGWIQFGYRFSNDFAPFLFAMIAVGGRRFGVPFYALGAAAIAVNGFGALTFQRAGFERFYFFERTQRVLHQPD